MKDYAKKDFSTKENASPEGTRLPETQSYKNGEKGTQGETIEGTLAPDSQKANINRPAFQLKSSRGWGGKRRIRSKREFNEIYSHGKNYTNSLVVLKLSANEKEYSRAAFSVGKKLGKAVARNKVKRLMREALRSLEVKPGWDLLFISRSAMMNSTFHQVRTSMKKVLGVAGLLLSDKP